MSINSLEFDIWNKVTFIKNEISKMRFFVKNVILKMWFPLKNMILKVLFFVKNAIFLDLCDFEQNKMWIFAPVCTSFRHFSPILFCLANWIKTDRKCDISHTMFENHPKCRIWYFFNFGIFCSLKSDLSANPVWPQASGFQKLAKIDHFWHL